MKFVLLSFMLSSAILSTSIQANIITMSLKNGCNDFLYGYMKNKNPFEAADTSHDAEIAFIYINGMMDGIVVSTGKSLSKNYTIGEVVHESCMNALYHDTIDLSFHSKIQKAVYTFFETKK